MTDFFQYGYLGLFIGCFLAATILPLSSEGIVVLMLIFNYSFGLTILVATAGNSAGSITSFYLGYAGKWKWIEKCLRIKREKIENFSLKVRKYGNIAAFFTFLPFIGDIIPIILGLFRAKILPVLFFITLGKFIRYFILGLIVLKFL